MRPLVPDDNVGCLALQSLWQIDERMHKAQDEGRVHLRAPVYSFTRRHGVRELPAEPTVAQVCARQHGGGYGEPEESCDLRYARPLPQVDAQAGVQRVVQQPQAAVNCGTAGGQEPVRHRLLRRQQAKRAVYAHGHGQAQSYQRPEAAGDVRRSSPEQVSEHEHYEHQPARR